MGKKTKKKSARYDGFQPKLSNKIAHPKRSLRFGYQPHKPNQKPNPPTSDTNVTTDKK